MIKKIVFYLLCSLPVWLSAQYDAPLRIELECAKDQNDYHFIAADTNGLFVIYEGNDLSPDTTTWVFVHYDTNFQKIAHFIIPMPTLTEYISAAQSEHFVYFLFQKRFPKKEPVQTLLLTIDLKNFSYNLQRINNLTNPKLTKLWAMDNHIALIAEEEKQDHLYFYDFFQKNHQEITNGTDYRIEFCEPDTVHYSWLIGLKEGKLNQYSNMHIYKFDIQDNTIHHYLLPPTQDITYNSLRAIVINTDTTLLLGTYNNQQDKHSSQLHSGVFTVVWNDTLFSYPKFFSYTGLKSQTAQSKKNDVSALNLQLLIAPTAHGKGQYTFITEVFYPEYNYQSSYYDDFGYGFGTNHYSGTTFAGYKFLNAYITTFDPSGNLLWDNFFPLSNNLTQSLRTHLSIHYLGQEALILYPRNNHIINTLLKNGETIIKLSAFPIETNSSRDVVEYNRHTQIQFWYGNNFIISGYQYLYTKGKRNDKRYVFFLNKVQYW